MASECSTSHGEEPCEASTSLAHPSPQALETPCPTQTKSLSNNEKAGRVLSREPSLGNYNDDQEMSNSNQHDNEGSEKGSSQQVAAPLPSRRGNRRSPADVLPALYQSQAHSFRLKHYQDEYSAYCSQLVSQEDSCRIRQNEMYQLLAMFALIQGVVFSAVAQSTMLNCYHRCLPISVSCITSFATIVALVRELIAIGELQHDMERTRERASAASHMIEEIKLKGEDFDLTREVELSNGLEIPERKQVWRYVFSAYSMSLLAFLLLLSVVVVVSSAIVLCRECRC